MSPERIVILGNPPGTSTVGLWMKVLGFCTSYTVRGTEYCLRDIDSGITDL
jgi:hypothetical protein